MSIQKSELLDLVKRYVGEDAAEKAKAEENISQILLNPPSDLVETIKLMLKENGYSEIGLGKELVPFGDLAWQAIMELANETNDKNTGWAIAWTLKEFTRVRTIEDYILALQHPNVHVRWSSALRISDFNDPRAIDHLLRSFHEPDETEQIEVGSYEENYHDKVRHCAAISLRKLINYAFNQVIAKIDDPNPLVRKAVADVFVDSMDPRAADALSKLLTDTSQVVRMRTLEAYKSLAKTQKSNANLRDLLIQQLYQPEQLTQAYAVKTIATYGVECIPLMLDIATNRGLDQQNKYTRYYALQVITTVMWEKPNISHLHQHLLTTLDHLIDKQIEEENLLVRLEAVNVLAQLQHTDVVSLLIKAMNDDDPYVLQSVMEAVKHYPSNRMMAEVKKLQTKWKDKYDEESSEQMPIEDLQWAIEATITEMAQVIDD